jgi:hypothetical protein
MSDRLAELFGKEEPLRQELAERLYHDTRLGPCVMHPLVFSVPHHPGLNALLNASLQQKIKYCDEALADGRYGCYISMHERPYRWDALQFLDDNLTLEPHEFWQLFGEVWIDTENQWQHLDWLVAHLLSGRPGKETMMDEASLEAYRRLPDVVTIHRGHQLVNRHGLSWTLDRDKAEWFAKRFRARRWEVTTRQVAREELIAIMLGRGEREVIWVPV